MKRMTGKLQRHPVPGGSHDPQDLVRIRLGVTGHQRVTEHEPRHLSSLGEGIPDGPGVRNDADLGADPRSSGVAPQPPLAYAAPFTGGGLAGLLASAVLPFRCAGVLVPAASGAWPAVQAVMRTAHAASTRLATRATPRR